MSSPPASAPVRKGWRRFFRRLLLLILVLFLPPFIFFSIPVLSETTTGQASDACQKSRDISVAFYAYSQDNDGKYPDGKSSTEVFQKLIDDKYISDASIFYYPMPGKIKAALEAKTLKPENVAFDITGGLDDHSPDNLPVVFLTTYKVTYQPGGNAVPLPIAPRSWSDWWNAKRYPRPFIVDSNKNSNAEYLPAAPNGSILHFIPSDFDPKGKTYRQLTPDGELSP